MCDGMGSLSEIEALAKLLTEHDQDAPKESNTSQHPGNIHGQTFPVHDCVPIKSPTGRPNTSIWTDDEVEAQESDPYRKEPRYTFLFKQTVEATDAYLGLGNKDPSSNCCEDLVLRIDLPGIQSAKEIDVDLKRDKVTVRTLLHELRLPLPHEVEEDKSKASWEQATQQLTLTLRRRDLLFNGM